jgi:hypothetical protein
MGHPRRYYKHGDTCLVTNRLAEGLPFVPNIFINCLLYGALARAASLNPGIVICAFGFLQNHYHLIVLIKSDEREMSCFLHDLDDELARIVKKLLGKSNIKVWAQRAHVAILGDAPAVIEHLGYCFLNPVEANFCNKASDWIGLHSFRSLFSPMVETYKWVRTRKLDRLANKAFTKRDIKRLQGRWGNLPGKKFELRADAFAWKSCFRETRELTNEELRDMILARVETGEKQCQKERRQTKQRIADPEQLACQNPYKFYKPKKHGRRVYCICTDSELRKQMIELYKAFCETCAAVWAAWKKGDLSAKFPPGAFIPPRTPLCNALAEFT